MNRKLTLTRANVFFVSFFSSTSTVRYLKNFDTEISGTIYLVTVLWCCADKTSYSGRKSHEVRTGRPLRVSASVRPLTCWIDSTAGLTWETDLPVELTTGRLALVPAGRCFPLFFSPPPFFFPSHCLLQLLGLYRVPRNFGKQRCRQSQNQRVWERRITCTVLLTRR